MKAAILNGTLNAGPSGPSIDEIIETVPGGVITAGQPTRSEGWDIDKATEYWKAGKKIQDAGKSDGSAINYNALLSSVAAGAAAGAGFAGVGAVLGAVVGAAIYFVTWFTGTSAAGRWADAGPNVHWWFTTYAPQSYLDWLDATGNTSVFASVKDSAKAYILYLLQEQNYVLRPNERHYANRLDLDYAWDATADPNPDARIVWLRQLYADLGVDWDATVDLWAMEGRSGVIMMKNRQFVPDRPTVTRPTIDKGPAPASSGDGLVWGGLAIAAVIGLSKMKSNN